MQGAIAIDGIRKPQMMGGGAIRLQQGTSPMAQGLAVPGNLDLWNRPVLHNQDGSYSTTSSFSRQDEDGLEVLVPSVIGGKRLSEDDAWSHYKKTGEHLGKFKNSDDADRYAQALHEAQAAHYDEHGNPLGAIDPKSGGR